MINGINNTCCLFENIYKGFLKGDIERLKKFFPSDNKWKLLIEALEKVFKLVITNQNVFYFEDLFRFKTNLEIDEDTLYSEFKKAFLFDVIKHNYGFNFRRMKNSHD